MGWFDDQIKERKLKDDEVFSDSFIKMAGSIMGERVYRQLNDSRINVRDSIGEILKFYHCKSGEVPETIKDVNDQLEYLMRPYGIMRRTVKLDDGWYKDAVGAMLTVRSDDGSVVALIPGKLSGYTFLDSKTGKRETVNRSNQDLFADEAIAFYKPFPLRKLQMADVVKYIVELITPADVVLIALTTLIVTLIGRLIPKLTNILFSNVISQKSYMLLFSVAVFLVCVTVSNLMFNAIRNAFSQRINTKMDVSVRAASMMRVLSLPASFFKNYSAGELSSRVGNVSTLCDMLVSSVFQSGFTAVFSLIYLTSIFEYAPALVVPSLVILLIQTVFSIISVLANMNLNQKKMELSSKESGMSYALISGVQKIKLSGAEKRAFARWADMFSQVARITYNPNMFIKANAAISTGITLLGTIILYTQAIANNVPYSNYFAFMSAYGMISAAFTGLISIAQNIAQIRPILNMVQPIFDAEPEVAENKMVLTKVSGSIEFNNVSFKYTDDGPNIVDDMSFKVRQGEYLAIVGKTGCGKSTLIRLLLGFEKPNSGAIYVDGKDLNSIDLKSFRRKIGVVMQEGKLFQGDIFSNIAISAPQLTLEEAWEAAEMAGVAEDIQRMPMGMNTIISEGSGGISGGQRQRLMIARAVAPKPKLLIFDEATSALDNITQKKVSESLDGLKCTRIVIAHRLSTIKHCDRILCLDGGKIIEDGTYDELIAKGGFFAELVNRQRIDVSTKE